MKILQPDGWKRPRGYSNGIAARGEQIFIAGQIGWNEREEIVSDDLAEQTAQALRNIAAILQSAGGKVEHIVRLTWYVTDKHEYLSASQRIGTAYRQVLGSHYPVMTLVQVGGLLEERAKVEIEATAVVPHS